MTNKKKIGLNMAFQSKENFLSFLKQEAQSTEFERKIKMVEKGSHPREDELYDYILGDLDEERSRAITNHILFCKYCAKEASTIMRIESETDEELLEATEKPPLLARLKKLKGKLQGLVETSIMAVQGFPLLPDSAYARGGHKKRGQQADRYHINDPIRFTVSIPHDGYLVAFNYDDTKGVEIIFPYNSDMKTKVSAGSKKNIDGIVEGPPGKQFLKAIWTSRNLLKDLSAEDFDDKSRMEHRLKDFFDILDCLDEKEWTAITYEYEVVEERDNS